MIATSAAILGAAVIGGAATAYGASKASKAANYASDQTAQATRETNALNEKIYNQTRTDNEPWRQTGVSALGALSGGFGLGQPSMTSPAPSYASTPVPGAGGVSMTGKAAGGFAGTSPLEPGTTSYAAAAPAAPAQPDPAAYGAANPDLQAEWQHIVATGNAGNDKFQNDPNKYYAWHYATHGQAEGREMPTTGGQAQPATGQPAAAAPATTGGAPAGYNDPTAPNGYGTGSRPDMGAGPQPYMTRPLDVSTGAFQASPDYQFRLSEGYKGLDHVASTGGGLMSGARIKAAQRFGQDIAGSEYDDWRNYTTSRYDTDRNFDYGQSRDARGDFVQDRARSDGLYADDRAFTTGRYDTRNAQLMTLAGFGQNANGANASAGTTYAQNAGAATMTAANARGDAKIAGANAVNQGIGNLLTTGAYLAGNYMTGGGGGSSLPRQYSI